MKNNLVPSLARCNKAADVSAWPDADNGLDFNAVMEIECTIV